MRSPTIYFDWLQPREWHDYSIQIHSIRQQCHHSEKASRQNYLLETEILGRRSHSSSHIKKRISVMNNLYRILLEVTFLTILFTRSFCVIPTAIANKLVDTFCSFCSNVSNSKNKHNNHRKIAYNRMHDSGWTQLKRLLSLLQ